MVPPADRREQARTGGRALGGGQRASCSEAPLERREGARPLALGWCVVFQSDAAFE
jgi:hypothetical protein